MSTPLRKLLSDRRGVTAIEYGLIAAVIVVASMLAFIGLGDRVTEIWSNVSREVVNAGQ